MRYQVPQFIEVEDKIFGPLTAKQFVYLAGAGGVALAAFSSLPLIFATLLTAPVVVFALALAFYSYNDRPFINVLEHAFRYVTSSKLYLWSAERAKKTEAKATKAELVTAPVPKLSEGKLRDLAWSLNIKDSRRESESEDL